MDERRRIGFIVGLLSSMVFPGLFRRGVIMTPQPTVAAFAVSIIGCAIAGLIIAQDEQFQRLVCVLGGMGAGFGATLALTKLGESYERVPWIIAAVVGLVGAAPAVVIAWIILVRRRINSE